MNALATSFVLFFFLSHSSSTLTLFPPPPPLPPHSSSSSSPISSRVTTCTGRENLNPVMRGAGDRGVTIILSACTDSPKVSRPRNHTPNMLSIGTTWEEKEKNEGEEVGNKCDGMNIHL